MMVCFEKRRYMSKKHIKCSTSLVIRKFTLNPQWDTISHLLEWLKLNRKTHEHIKVVRIWSKWDSDIFSFGSIKWYNDFRRCLAVPYKTKDTPTLWFSKSSSLHLSQRNKDMWIQKTHTSMFMSTLFITANTKTKANQQENG